MAISYGTYTIAEVQEGSQIWTTTVAPATPNYTFTVSNLTGDSETSVKVGDIIMYSYYRYTVLSVSADGTTVFAGNRQGFASTVYQLIVSPVTVIKDKNGVYSPYYVTLTAKSKTGTNTMGNYQGRFKIETTTDNENWETQYTSTLNESTVELDFSELDDIVALRCSLYASGGTSTLLDQQVISVVTDGIDGNDAYTVILTNENHTFAGNTTSAIASEIECNVIAYKGTTQIAATIGTITGQPTGMTTSLLNNGTVNAAFRVSVTSSMVTKNGVLNVPITVDNKVFTKKFTYGLALDGEDGKDGGRWYSGTSITGTSTTATVFSGSGISSAVEGDMYLNTSTYNTYRCTLGGDASTAKWIYVNNIKGVHGDTGKGVSSIVNQYYLSTSNTTQIGGSWSTTVPPYVEDCYYWTKSHIVWTDNTETDTTAVLDNGLTDANANAIDARKVATNYLAVDNTGIMVANMEDGEQTPSTATGRNVFIDNDSVDIRDGQNTLASFTGNNTKFYDITSVSNREVASFGANGVRVGSEEEQHFIVDSESIQAINENGSSIFSVQSTGGTITTEIIVAKGGNSQPHTDWEVYLNGGSSVPQNTFYAKEYSLLIDIDNSINTFNSMTVSVNDGNFQNVPVVRTQYQNSTGMTVYSRHLVTLPPFSFQYGTETVYKYHVEGVYVSDKGNTYRYSTTIHIPYDGQRTITMDAVGGTLTQTSGSVSGDNTSVPYGGNSTIWGDIYSSLGYAKAPAMTFGTRGKTGIVAPLSVTIGEELYANNDNQLSIGRYNINNDEFSPLAFAIGNGTSDNDRSNAFAVDWDGRVETGDIKATGLLLEENSKSEMDDYILCEDENRNPKFRVLNDGGAIVGHDLLVKNCQTVDKNLTVTGIASVVGNIRLNGRLLDASSANNPLFKVVTVTVDNLTISYNNSVSSNVAVNASGYTPVAIGSYQISNSTNYTSSYAAWTWAIMGYHLLSSGRIYYYVGNWHSSSPLRVKLTFTVLCIKSTAL